MQMMKLTVSILLAFILFPLSPAFSEFSSLELRFIPWGDSFNQLMIDLPIHEDVYNTPKDSIDDWIEFRCFDDGLHIIRWSRN
jgi:hypothetical protein